MSESKEETIADIVAEMRKERNACLAVHSNAPSYTAWRLDEYAKRIEAAAGIGQDTKPSSAGNAAALREALEKISLLSSAPPTHWKPIAVIEEIGKLADAALLAPPRNCDRFQTKEDAAMAFNKERRVFIPQSILWQLGEWLDWLFAAAGRGAGQAQPGHQDRDRDWPGTARPSR